MTKTIRLCNICGKEIAQYDDFNLSYQYGYGSSHDGDNLNIDLCNTCLDKLTTYLVENCKINPVTERGGY